jgi:hypothetical protein
MDIELFIFVDSGPFPPLKHVKVLMIKHKANGDIAQILDAFELH